MLPTTLFQRARLFPSIDPRHDSGSAIFTVKKIVNLLSEMLPGQLTVLGSRAGLLAFDNDARWKVFELDGGAGLVLLQEEM